jgi:hypothetical protein
VNTLSRQLTVHSDRLPCHGLRTGLLVQLAIASGLATAETLSSAHFSEPLSGRKVAQYTIDLPVARDRTMGFAIPQQCADVVRYAQQGQAYRGRAVGRSLWHKAESDCRYHAFLHFHPQQQLADHVSGYDFMNMPLTDLPLSPQCASGATDKCGRGITPQDRLWRHLLAESPTDRIGTDELGIACRFVDGKFSGRAYLTPQGLRCSRPAPDRPGMRLIAVDFADINGDRIMDAVLRIIPTGPRSTRVVTVLPLTRLAAERPLQFPDFGLPALPAADKPIDQQADETTPGE